MDSQLSNVGSVYCHFSVLVQLQLYFIQLSVSIHELSRCLDSIGIEIQDQDASEDWQMSHNDTN